MDKTALVLGASILALGVGSAASAEGAEPVAQPPQANMQLQEVVVTAQRRTEKLQSAPIAVTAVTGEAVRAAGVISPAQLGKLVPALQIGGTLGPYSNFYLRGVGNISSNALQDSAVAFNYDGVYVARPSATNGFFYDVDRIEILKGPQGTLYGRNATGGAINVLPAQPKFHPEATASAEFGNYASVRLDGMVNLPLSDTVAVRAAGIFTRHDGYLKDGTDDQKQGGARLQLLYAPTDKIDVRIAADYFKIGGKGPGATPVTSRLKERDGVLSPESTAWFNSLVNVIGLAPYPSPAGLHPFLTGESWGVNATVNYGFDGGTITFIPAYREMTQSNRSALYGAVISPHEHDAQKSVELRYASPDTLPLRGLVGAFAFNEQALASPFVTNYGYLYAYQSFGLDTTSYAAFGRLTYAIRPNLRLTGGIRYSHEDKKFVDVTDQRLLKVCLSAFCPASTPFDPNLETPPALLSTFVGNAAIPRPGDGGSLIIGSRYTLPAAAQSIHKITWRAAADWDVTPANLLYVSYETGFKSGGFFQTPVGPTVSGKFRPETVKAWTFGSKNRFFDNRLQVNVEGFYWKYADQQQASLFLNDFGEVVFGTRNVGNSTIKGVEVDIQALATENTLLTADLQYLSAMTVHYSFLYPNLGGPPQIGCPSTLNPNQVNYTVECAGKQLPQAPEWTINLGLQQKFPLASGARVVFGGQAHYQSKTLTGQEFVASQYQSGYWLADATLTYESPGDRYSIGLFANNLTNETVKANTIQLAFTPGQNNAFAVLRPPRTYGVRLSARY